MTYSLFDQPLIPLDELVYDDDLPFEEDGEQRELDLKDTVFKRVLSAATLINKGYSMVGYDGSDASDEDLVLAWRYCQFASYLSRYHSIGQAEGKGYLSWKCDQHIAIAQMLQQERMAALKETLERRGLYEFADNGYLIHLEVPGAFGTGEQIQQTKAAVEAAIKEVVASEPVEYDDIPFGDDNSEVDPNENECPVPGCDNRISRLEFCCIGHWNMVPRTIKEAIESDPSDRHAKQALDAIARAEGFIEMPAEMPRRMSMSCTGGVQLVDAKTRKKAIENLSKRYEKMNDPMDLLIEMRKLVCGRADERNRKVPYSFSAEEVRSLTSVLFYRRQAIMLQKNEITKMMFASKENIA